MSKQRQALKLALEALEQHGNSYLNHEDEYSAAMGAIRQALAEPESWTPDDMAYRPGGLSMGAEQKPLTDEQISAIVQSMSAYTWDAHMLARAIERAHGIQ